MVAGIAQVVCAFEHMEDSRDERDDGIVGILVAGVRWECKFADCCCHMVPLGGVHCEAGICHVSLLDLG